MKSLFQFSNQERSGILLLLLVILSGQAVYWFVDFSDNPVSSNMEELNAFQIEIDSLKALEIQNNKPKIYPFNPNFITDFKGYNLGMSSEEIDRLHQFRASNQWINSKAQFQSVTQISDSLLYQISPYFKFPDWVTNPKSSYQITANTKSDKPKSIKEKIDLNLATSGQLQKVYGIGEKLAERIIAYRNKFEEGFAADVELTEIYGLKPEVIERLKNDFTVKTPRAISKINLNTASRDDLVTIKYIDYEVANNIIEERILRDSFKSLEELTKVEDFPVHKIEIIKLYLQL